MRYARAALGIAALSTASRGNVLHTVWVLCNLVDTLRSLREVRQNGRRIGVQTRRKLIKQCLVGWIVFVAAQPVGIAADTLLFWFPFYKSVKALIILILVVWRFQLSGMLFENFVAPALRRHETHIDLTILLVHSVYALLAAFFIHLPWQVVCALFGWSSGDGGGEPDGVASPKQSRAVSHTASPRDALRRARNCSLSSGPANERKDRPPREKPAVAERPATTRKVPAPASSVSPAIAERRKTFEREPEPIIKAARKPKSAATARGSAPKPAAVAATGPSTASAPVRRAPARRPPAAGSAPGAAEATAALLLASLPAPPSTLPRDSHSPGAGPAGAPPAPPGIGLGLGRPPARTRTARPVTANGTTKGAAVNKVSPPKKRPRTPAADAEQRERPAKRSVSGGMPGVGASAGPSRVASTRAKAPSAEAAGARSRVVSREKREVAGTSAPKTKRTRAAAAATATAADDAVSATNKTSPKKPRARDA